MKRLKFKTSYKLICVFIILLLFVIILINNNFLLISNTDYEESVGIIDGNITTFYDNVSYFENRMLFDGSETHGDKMIDFALKIQKNLDLYYFDATNELGVIDTNSIIKGLDWMLENSVTRVNISLSSKTYSMELAEWISNHDEIMVFASYNNRMNTNDFPAMYEGVYGSGSNSKVTYKSIDIQYSNNRIMICSAPLGLYNGNSYLSILSMLQY